MEDPRIRITLRVTAEEKRKIDEYAAAEQKTLNQYVRDKALNSGRSDDKLRCDILRNICQLNVEMQPVIGARKYEQIPSIIYMWEDRMMKVLEG